MSSTRCIAVRRPLALIFESQKIVKQKRGKAARFELGDEVYGLRHDGKWYPGVIGSVSAEGTSCVDYTDGDVGEDLDASSVRPHDDD